MIIVKYLGVLITLLMLSACSTLSYYSQTAKGHLTLMAKRKPIKRVLQDASVTEDRKRQLKLVQEILDFAHQRLKLPDNGSYEKYVELRRKAVTWNVIVTPKYSMTPSQWCFPVVGCISYKGYFSEKKALKEAKSLEALGYDVYVADATAYSTLGWFKDPIVSTMLDHGIILTAETIFHELAHQQVYHKNDSEFNEAFATAVGQVGTRLWLKQKHPDSLKFYQEHLRKQRQFIGLLLDTSKRLDKLYHIKMSDNETEKKKQQIIQELRKRYAQLKQSWHGDNRYDAWFDKPINNARLALIGVYFEQIPKFVRLIEQGNYDFPKFYQKMKEKIVL